MGSRSSHIADGSSTESVQKFGKKNQNKPKGKAPVVDTTNVEFRWNHQGDEVLLTGSFTDWKNHIRMERVEDEFRYIMKLPKGVHYYKFIVDGEWKYNPDEPSTPDATGNINNYIDNTKAENDANFANEAFPQSTKNEMDEEDRIAPTRPKQIASSASKKSALFGLVLDNEAPPLPPCFESALFLNKNKQRLKTIKENNHQYKEFAFLMKLLDNPLVPPTHAEVNHLGVFEPSEKEPKKYELLFTNLRFRGKYCTYKFYTPRK